MRAPSCKALRRRRNRSPYIPGSSRSTLTGRPRWCSIFRISPAPHGSWRSPGRKARSAEPQRDVTIRDPLVLTATLPRFLLNGDRGTMHLDLDNVEGPAGDYQVETRNEGVNVIGASVPQTLKLAARQRSSIVVPLSAERCWNGGGGCAGAGPAGFALDRRLPPQCPAGDPNSGAPYRSSRLRRGESLTLSNDVFADLVPGSTSVALSAGSRRRSMRQRCWQRSIVIHSGARSRSPAALCRSFT